MGNSVGIKIHVFVIGVAVLLVGGGLAWKFGPWSERKPVPMTAKKENFFNRLKPAIASENQRIRDLRDQLSSDQLDQGAIAQLAEQYRVEVTEDSEAVKAELMLKVDEIPESLALAQAAIESQWGESRFAREANNYYGQWCFEKGCGLVPKRRGEGKTHEVQTFGSLDESVRSYMLNLNRHPSYAELREIRADMPEGERNGCDMAEGLLKYSEIGDDYIEMLKDVMGGNRLEASCS